jgi:hypothetical protein
MANVTTPINNSLDEVTDPIARAKLSGIQETVFGVSAMIIQSRKSIDEKRGVIAAADAIAQRVIDECVPLSKAAGEEKLDKDEAKIRIDTTQKLAAIIRGMAAENRKELVHLQGQIVGLERAAKSAEEHFNSETAKFQRYQRMEAEDEDELGRQLPETGEDTTLKATPKAIPVRKTKTIKTKASN